MPKTLSMEQTYDKCVIEGSLLPQEKVDINRIRSMLGIIDEYLLVRNKLKGMESYNVQYDNCYTIIHMMTEALLLFDRIKSSSHQCLFTALCVKHPELELDWDFFERLRTRRNGLHYYGTAISRQDWKEAELQAEIYIRTLHAALIKNIQENNP